MADPSPRGWVKFFSELSAFLLTCGRQYGVANEQYTEYAIERLSLSCQSVQSLIRPIRMSRTFASTGTCSSYVDNSLDQQWASSHYVTPTEVPHGRGRPRFQISKEQLECLHSLSFSWTAIAGVLMVSWTTVYRRRVEFGLLIEPQSSITDQKLMRIVWHLSVQYPQVGQSLSVDDCGHLDIE